jgi:hypothetical protein
MPSRSSGSPHERRRHGAAAFRTAHPAVDGHHHRAAARRATSTTTSAPEAPARWRRRPGPAAEGALIATPRWPASGPVRTRPREGDVLARPPGELLLFGRCSRPHGQPGPTVGAWGKIAGWRPSSVQRNRVRERLFAPRRAAARRTRARGRVRFATHCRGVAGHSGPCPLRRRRARAAPRHPRQRPLEVPWAYRATLARRRGTDGVAASPALTAGRPRCALMSVTTLVVGLALP